MRRSPISSAVAEEEDINLTPMLDVVFILLIFFIVTANFIKEPGLEVNRPDAETSNIQENAAILIAIGATNDIWIDGRRVDVRQVKANITKLLADNLKNPFFTLTFDRAKCEGFLPCHAGLKSHHLVSSSFDLLNSSLKDLSITQDPLSFA